MEPLSAEEKAEHELDPDIEYFWSKNKNIHTKDGRIFRRFDMDKKMAKEIKRKGVEKKKVAAQDTFQELMYSETGIDYDDAPKSLQLACVNAATGGTSDMRLFLELARGIGKLASKAPDSVTQKVVVEMDKDVREAMIRGIEIIERGQQRRDTGEDTSDRPF